MAGAGLDNVNILSTDRVLDLASALTAREFGEGAVAGRDAKDVANAISQLGVGVTAEQNNVANHVCRVDWLGSTSTGCIKISVRLYDRSSRVQWWGTEPKVCLQSRRLQPQLVSLSRERSRDGQSSKLVNNFTCPTFDWKKGGTGSVSNCGREKKFKAGFYREMRTAVTDCGRKWRRENPGRFGKDKRVSSRACKPGDEGSLANTIPADAVRGQNEEQLKEAAGAAS